MISTEVFSNVIIFHDGSRKFITEEQYTYLLEQQSLGHKSITTPKLGYIAYSSIAKIPEILDFYNQYPDERPEYRPEWKGPVTEPYKSLEEQALATERGRNGLIEGLNKFINQAQGRGENPVHAMEILENYKAGRLTGAEKRKKGYWQAVYEKYKDKQDRNESEEKHYQYALNKINEVKVFA
jgi:hypothetical protein